MTMDLSTLSVDLFEARIGSGFLLAGPDGLGIEATLVKCPTHPRATMPGAARTAFSLILSAPNERTPDFNGGCFIVHHAQMAPFGPVHVERIMSGTPGTAMLQIIFN